MRFLKLSISSVFVLLSLLPTKVFAGVNDFYFEDFTGDYYLSRDEEGLSRLKVVEQVTAVFPDYNQNKGICRQIPFTNQGGVNTTLPDLNRFNLKLTRNGNPEPIYSIEKTNARDAGYYEVCTGDDDYVLGRQVYVFEYEYTKVITEFDNYQELYWDTNGTGSFQKFNKVTARVHFASDIAEAFDGGKWCYVGAYGENGADRCTISEISDGWQFSASELDRFENVTFDVEFKLGTFVVPEPEKNYILIVILVIFTILVGLILIPFINKYRRTSEKRNFYKGFFVKPEYQPNPNYTIAEMTTIYMGDKKDSKIGVLLDMIVKKQITIIKDPKKSKKWTIVVEKLDEIEKEGKILLNILNGGTEVKAGEEIEVKKHTATPSLAKIGRSYFKNITSKLKQDGLVDSKKYRADAGRMSFSTIVVDSIFIVFLVLGITSTLLEEITDDFSGAILVFEEYFVITAIIIALIAFIIGAILNREASQYDIRTELGLKMSRYMDGLKLYIGMAEAERLKMLQSVEGADTSASGIVHLYEKLLPYAAIFGLEKSWLKELEKYYEVNEVEEPEWHRGFSTTDVILMSNLMTRYLNQSVNYSSGGSGISGGGGFSSGFSGGGGGGFSGGGGGGGGFSGR